MIMADSMAGGARLGEHAENMADEARNAAKDFGGQVSEQASKYAHQAKEYAQQGYKYAADKSQQVKETTEGYITENPWYAVGIALGVGVLIGMLVRGGHD
jgi:ElaB/YqjD/DUF883 family membrane-anchored ribosome-binding protein